MTSASQRALWLALALAGVSATACSNDDDDNGDSGDFETDATLEVKTYVGSELDKLHKAAQDIQAAAPAPDDDGWNYEDDKAAVDKMREAWARARVAYEHVEGSIAVLFPDLDESADQRYDAFIEVEPDDNLFDDEGVTGVHAIERILWAGFAPERVVKFEAALTGYEPAEFPSTNEQADEFKNKLAKRLVDDTETMRQGIEDTTLDSSTAFRGVIGSMEEQSEKTTKAASGEDESRYAQYTLADMRANLAGAKAVFAAFKPWIDATGKQSAKIETGFKEVDTAYSDTKGDALPEVPEGFNPDDPSDDDLNTPYGKLWKLLNEQTDLESPDSLVSIMADAADDMKIPLLPD